MAYEIKILEVKAQPLAVIRGRATPKTIGATICKLMGDVWSVPKEARVGQYGRNVAFYPIEERKPPFRPNEDFPVEAGMEVPAPFESKGPIICSETPAGRVATVVHMGPYDKIPEAGKALQEWCKAHGHVLAGPSWEVYGHWMDEWNNDPSKIRTDIFFLLK